MVPDVFTDQNATVISVVVFFLHVVLNTCQNMSLKYSSPRDLLDSAALSASDFLTHRPTLIGNVSND